MIRCRASSQPAPGRGQQLLPPHLRLELEPELMSADERRQTAAALRNAIEMLDSPTRGQAG